MSSPLVALLVLLLALIAQAPLHAQALPRLLGSDVMAKRQSTSDSASLRTRTVDPDVSLVEDLARAHASGAAGQRFLIDLFPGQEVQAEVVDAQLRATGATVIARLPDRPLGSAVLTLEAGVLVATVDSLSGRYRVERRADGRYDVEQQMPQAFTEGLPPRPVPGRSSNDTARADVGTKDAPADSGRLIDMLIVWSPAAEASAGGSANMRSQAQAAVDSLNAAFLNSGIGSRIRLVHSTRIEYVERTNCNSGALTIDCALDDVTFDNDGYIDSVHALRNVHGADLVGFIIGNSPPWCGLAWIPTSIGAENAPYGFSVSTQGCAVSGRGFAHEAAHNLGANHDPAHHSGDGPKPYNVGHVDPQGAWRTIMSYGAACSNCAQVDYFSNPRLRFVDGDALGTPGANNALVIDLVAEAAANYRPTSSLHPVAQRFADVPATHAFYGHIEFLAQAAVTSGCGAALYCPDNPVTRGQMAVFLERTIRASNWSAPAAAGIFADVLPGAPFSGPIEQLYWDGITQGCSAGPLRYCPDQPVTRGQMAVFLLRASCGASFVPAAPQSALFDDVPIGHPFGSFIHKLHALGITSGCATAPLRYCPDSPVTRGQMAAFIERSFPYRAPSEACSP